MSTAAERLFESLPAHLKGKSIFTDENLKDMTRYLARTKYKLHPATKKAWVKRLRSGDYEQGDGYLCRIYTDSATGTIEKLWCCLGVLGDQLRVHKRPAADRLGTGNYALIFGDEGVGTINYLPPKNMPLRLQKFFAEVNDSGFFNFDEVADLVEVLL
jgi:hypothetical protein